MSKKTTTPILNYIVRTVLSTFLLCAFLVIGTAAFPHKARAQNHNENMPVIENNGQNIMLSPYSYVTIDYNKNLTPDSLISRYKNNLRGERVNSDIIHLKATQEPTWIVFTIYNKTSMDDWILDFGKTFSGRMGIIKNLTIINYTANKSIQYPNKNSQTPPFLGNAIPIQVTPNAENIFIIYLEPATGLPVSFAPQLTSQHQFMHELINGDITTIIATSFFICMAVFFMLSYFIGRNKASLCILSYYMLLSALYFNLNVHIVSDPLISGSSLLFVYVAALIMLILSIKFFMHISHEYAPMQNMALIALGLGIAGITTLYLFILGITLIGILTLCIALSIGICIAIFISMISSKKTKSITILFNLGIACSLVQIMLIMLPSINVLAPTSSIALIFWGALLPQSILFILAYLKSNIERKEKNELKELQHDHEKQSLARLQKSKDSADQARLLRVIERERELMAELRGREVKRTEEMRIAKDIADKANQAKSAFLAVVSHEIRTPMNGILGMVQLLQQTSLSTQQHEYASTIKKSGDTMMALLNDILDFEKIERGGMELENVPFDLRQLVKDVITLMSGHAAQNNLKLLSNIEENVPIAVKGDPTRLRQVLLNLVNNGLKFTKEGSVSIKIALDDETGRLIFKIVDTGIGISQEAMKRLFTPFAQAESSTTRKYGGTGLGLAISNRLIETMGGKIEVSSIENEGSTFYFNLYLEHVHDEKRLSYEENDTSLASSEMAKNKINILIVEDNEMNRKVMEGLLQNQGHKLLVASNGLEAIDICNKNPNIDLILMDIEMPGLSGTDTTKKIRNNTNNKISSLPIIALTGNVMLEHIEQYFSVGMNGFVSKPVDAKNLYKVINNAALGIFENPIQKNGVSSEKKQTTDSLLLPQKKEEPKDNEKTPTHILKKNREELMNTKTNLSFDDSNEFSSSTIPPIRPLNQSTPTTQGDKKTTTSNSNRMLKTKNDDELTEVQKFLLSKNLTGDQAEEKTSDNKITDKTIHEENTKEDHHILIEDYLDISMLNDLKNSLGEEQFSTLLDGFVKKADEIIVSIQQSAKERNMSALSARAHELKGMAGNFGMKQISSIAANIEKMAKTAQQDKAIEEVEKLNTAHINTNTAFKKWKNL